MNGRLGRLSWLAMTVILTVACLNAPIESGTPRPIVIAAGTTTGVYFQYAQALKTTLTGAASSIDVLSTSGSVENINLLAKGKAWVAFSTADAADEAIQGTPPFSGQIPVRAVARLYDDYLHLVVPAGSGVRHLADLRGHRVSVGGAGSGTQLIADRLLALAGVDSHTDITAEPLNLADSAAALRAGRIDAFFWSGGLPTDGVTALAETTPIRLVDLHSEAAQMRASYGSAYRTGTIPQDTYPGVGALSTVAVPNLLITMAGSSDASVEDFTRSMFDAANATGGLVPAAQRLDPTVAIFTGPIPLHPGAQHYYRITKAGV